MAADQTPHGKSEWTGTLRVHVIHVQCAGNESSDNINFHEIRLYGMLKVASDIRELYLQYNQSVRDGRNSKIFRSLFGGEDTTTANAKCDKIWNFPIMYGS